MTVKQNDLLKNLVCLAIAAAILPSFNSCKKGGDLQEKEIVLPDGSDDREISNVIVAYNVENDSIYLNKTFPMPSDHSMEKEIWEKQQQSIEQHKKQFKFFADIIPAEYRNEITRFTISYPEKGSNVYAAIGRRKNSSLSEFSLDFSYDIEKGKTIIPAFSAPNYKINTLGYDLVTYAMIHEFGHYITLNKTQADLTHDSESGSYVYDYKKDSFIRQIMDISWVKIAELPDEIFMAMNPSEVFKALPGEFVTAYACSSMDEDGAETFSHFVLLEDKPEEIDGKSRKILLFYKDPEMVKMRTKIRQNLKNMGIAPGKPNV